MCRCDGECLCRVPAVELGPKSFADFLAAYVQYRGPVAECSERRCKASPETCKCRRPPNIAEPGW